MEFSVNNDIFKFDIDLSDKIEINSSMKTYQVYYSKKNLSELLEEIYNNNDFIFIDRNVYKLEPSVFINLKSILLFDANETNKTIENVLELTDKLYSLNFTKNNKLIVIGGGITQDVGGFAAAIFKRGIDWIYIPTTILSMTDSCIGSKVNINRISKNILGMFFAPNKIFISDYFLNSLTNDDIISGIGEAIKLSLIGGDNIYKLFLDKFNKKDYISIIKLSSLVKKKIIEYDEFEKNIRKVLNYGHTIGHAIESTTNYFIPHGIAVLIGIYIKNKLFYDNKYYEINKFILNLIDQKFFNIDFDFELFITHILSDKKNKGNDVCLILLDDIGKTKIIYKNIELIKEELKPIINHLFHKIN